MPPPSPTAYIREATPADFKQLTIMQTRSYAADPLMLWFGNAQQKLKVPAKDEKLKKPLKTLYHFLHGLSAAALLVGGRILMMVDKDENGKENILAVVEWIPPGKKLDKPLLILRSKQYKTMFGTFKHLGGWGLTGLSRVAFQYAPICERMHEQYCATHSLKLSHCWTVACVATDPDEQGKGYCSRLLQEGFKTITKETPAVLEASSPKSKAVYERQGFEVTGTPIFFGKGQVSEEGIPTSKGSKEPPTGLPVWTMIRMPNSPT